MIYLSVIRIDKKPYPRRLIAQAAGGPLLMVVAAPGFDLFLSILQAQKPVLIQAFLPKPAVERFDEGVVCGLAWPGKIQDHAMSISPQVNFFGDELRAIIHLEALRHPTVDHRQVEGGDHIIALVAESCSDKGTNTKLQSNK